jgi:hypothetical protein
MTPVEERAHLVHELMTMAVRLRMAGDLVKREGYCPSAQNVRLPEGHSLTSALMAVSDMDEGWTEELMCRVAGMLLLTGLVSLRVHGSVAQLVDSWEGMLPPHRPTGIEAVALLSATAAALEAHAQVVAFPAG